MSRQMKYTILLCFSALSLMAQGEPVRLAPGPSPADNPLKGLVPYADPEAGAFPHSLEFDCVRFGDLVTGPESFNWEPLEDLLDGIASRGNQAVFRIWIEYPGKESGLPAFLRDQGVKVTEWTDQEKKPREKNFTPDYEDERLITTIENFVAALGKRYDGDARIGYLTGGLLGSWGEWHTYPREDLFASVQTQKRVLDAYEKAFRKTPVLLRYPVGEDKPDLAGNANRPFGYHDDSFAWGTLDNGKEENSWFFMPSLKAAGDAAMNKWRTHPIGGEVRPEVWGEIHDERPGHKRAQDFMTCVEQTHVTWLMESGIFQKKLTKERYTRAISHVRRMGYDFHLPTARISRKESALEVQLTVVNQGVAPFYQDWPLELAALDQEGRITKRWPVDWKLTGLLPGDPARAWTAALDADAPLAGQTLALRVINPLSNGKPLRFANADQDRDAPGWLSLGRVP